jgi:hypothetical protein
MDAPKIKTALPQRRYQLGEFTAVILGDIESADGIGYRYILAMVREGDASPCLYVTLEKNRRSEAAQGSHRMRMVAHNYNEVLGSSDRWSDLEIFVREALTLSSKVLQLGDEQPVRLM